MSRETVLLVALAEVFVAVFLLGVSVGVLLENSRKRRP